MIDSPFASSRAVAAPLVRVQETPWWGRMSLLWAMLAPVCVWIYTLGLPLGANDFWYHARAGRFIWETRSLPHTALFSSAAGWTTPQTPYFYQSWLSEIALYGLLRIGGLSAVMVARSLLMSAAFALLTWAAWRRVQRVAPRADPTSLARWCAGGALLGFAMCALNLDTRPQMFSVPIFAGFVAALWEWPHLAPVQRRKLGIWLCIVMVVWANAHGAFFSGLLMVFAIAGGETVGTIVKRGPERDFSTARSLWALSAALFAATLLNPRGPGLYLYGAMMGRNPVNRAHIAEWQSPHVSPSEWYNGVFFACFALLPLLGWLAFRARRAAGQKIFLGGRVAEGASPVHWGEAAALLLLASMGLLMTRAVIWAALASVPVAAALGVAAFVRREARPQAATGRGAARVNAGLALFLPLLGMPLLPAFKAQLPWPPAFRARFAPTPRGTFPRGFAADPPLLLDKDTPVRSAEFLRRSPPRGRLWNDMALGSYLTWAVAPRIKPSCCPRVELYPLGFWNEYARLSGGPPGAPQLLQKRGYSDALLSRENEPRLIRRLRATPGWKIVFREGSTVLLRHFAAVKRLRS